MRVFIPVLSPFRGKAMAVLLTEILRCQTPSLGIKKKNMTINPYLNSPGTAPEVSAAPRSEWHLPSCRRAQQPPGDMRRELQQQESSERQGNNSIALQGWGFFMKMPYGYIGGSVFVENTEVQCPYQRECAW